LRDKLIALVCYYGTCRIADVIYLDFSQVRVHEDHVVVEINRAKSATSEARTEFIIPRSDGVDPVALFRAYIAAQKDATGRFWRHYQNEKWTTPMGHNTLATTASRIATALGLPEPKRYTGHCFRRTSATALANAGASLTEIKRAGGWRSDTVCQRYVAGSVAEQQKTAKMLAPVPAAAAAPAPAPTPAPAPASASAAVKYTFTNCSNFAVTIYAPGHQESN